MKKLLILIVAAALFLHFYPQPLLTNWFEDKKADVMETVADFSDTKVRLKADKIFSDLQSQFSTFSPEEVNYLKEITASKKTVSRFYADFCQGKKRDIVFHPKNKIKVCETINHYHSMF